MPAIAPVPTPADFSKKWNIKFADNTIRKINEATFREFAADIAATFGVTVANVPAYQPGTTYQDGYLVRFTPAAGNESFFYSLKPGVLPEPTTDPADKNWRLVPGPVSAVALSQQLTFSQAQAIEGLLVVPGRSYVIDFGPDARGNQQLVTLLGTAANLFAIRGQLTVAGVRSNVRVNVTSGVFGVESFALLDTANSWLEGQTFEKGIKLPAGAKVDEGGSAFFQRLDIGQRHYTFGVYYSLGKDGMIQWKPTEFINQDGDGDVGLARFGAGVLEVNTGTPGQLAKLRVRDLLLPGATATAPDVALTDVLAAAKTAPGLGMVKVRDQLGLQPSVATVALPPFAGIGLISDSDGTVVAGNDFADTYRYTPYLALDPVGGPITFRNNSRPQFGAYYDSNLQFLRAVNAYGTSATDYPAGGAYMRLSFPVKSYATEFYGLGRLPYVRGLQVNGATLYPDASGLLDASKLGTTTPGASTFAQLGGNPRDNQALASELNAVLALSDGRRNLLTTSSGRYNDLVLESRVTLTNLKRGPNASAVSGQLLQNGTVAVSAPRQGNDADVLAALNADIAALADYTFYIIRFQTSVAVSTDVAHVLLTVAL